MINFARKIYGQTITQLHFFVAGRRRREQRNTLRCDSGQLQKIKQSAARPPHIVAQLQRPSPPSQQPERSQLAKPRRFGHVHIEKSVQTHRRYFRPIGRRR